MLDKIQTALKHNLIQNISALYGVQFVRYLLPLVTVPYLARVLGVQSWGALAFAQSFGMYVSLVIEYGFSFSATREVALYQQDSLMRSKLLGEVIFAKGFLSLLVIVFSIFIGLFVPFFQERLDLLIVAILWGTVEAHNLIWYFQGLEQMNKVAILDISAKLLGAILIFILIKSPSDDTEVLFIYAIASFVSTLIGIFLAYRQIPFVMPKYSSLRSTLRSGWSMFIFKGSVSFYTVGNAFILGLFASSQYVGYYASAEKVSKALFRLFLPISQAIFPHLSKIIWIDRVKAIKVIRFSLLVMGVGSASIGIIVFLYAPVIIRVIFGAGFDGAISVLRIFSLLIPIISISNVLGIQWMLPLRMDRIFIKIVLSTGIINFLLALLWVSRYKHVGMAWAVILAESYAVIMIYIALRQNKLSPVFQNISTELEIEKKNRK